MITSDGIGTRELLDSDNSPVRWSVLGIRGLMTTLPLDIERVVREVLARAGRDRPSPTGETATRVRDARVAARSVARHAVVSRRLRAAADGAGAQPALRHGRRRAGRRRPRGDAGRPGRPAGQRPARGRAAAARSSRRPCATNCTAATWRWRFAAGGSRTADGRTAAGAGRRTARGSTRRRWPQAVRPGRRRRSSSTRSDCLIAATDQLAGRGGEARHARRCC